MPADSFLVAALPFDVRPGEVEANRDAALVGVERAAGAGACLLVLPEKWTTSFLPSFPEEVRAASHAALAAVHEAAAAVGIVVVGSAPGGEAAKPANRLHFLGRGGARHPYDKRVLFSPTGEGRQCRPGSALPPTLDLGFARAAGVICYDLRFPELTRRAFYDGADLLLLPAQWPTPRAAILELLARARAAENQCWLLACNRAGRASLGSERVMEFPGTALLVDPLGEVVTRVDDGGLLLGEVDLAEAREVRKRVPCARDARLAGLWPEGAE
jgi:omega-amidase